MERPPGDEQWLIVGCGYTGTRVAARLLREGVHVTVTRRSAGAAEESRAALELTTGGRLTAHSFDSARDDLRALISSGMRIVVTAAPGDDSPASEERIARAAAQGGASVLVYISSTGVYPPGDGAWVDETQAVAPASAHGRRRAAAETALLAECAAASLPAVSVRAAGIYGPGRGVHWRIKQGTYSVLGAGDSYVSRIHVDDLAGAAVIIGRHPSPPHAVVNAADDLPTTSREIADGIAAELGVSPPPSRDLAEASEMARALLTANRRISNRRLVEEFGVRLAYPTWREGVRQALAEEEGGDPR